MTSVQVERIAFHFEPTVEPFQYERGGVVVDGWPGGKVVDVVVHELPRPPVLAWLVEAKDFRVITDPPRPSNLGGLAGTVEAKVRSTLAGLQAVASGSHDVAARAHATDAAAALRRRVVLHLEPHAALGAHAALFPPNYVVNVLLKLRQLVADIDPDPLVLDIARTATAPVPWSAS